jgi:flagellin-like protein
MRKLRNNKRGLSPILAVLILIAIAVVAGIITYMLTSSYLATMTGRGAGQENVLLL